MGREWEAQHLSMAALNNVPLFLQPAPAARGRVGGGETEGEGAWRLPEVLRAPWGLPCSGAAGDSWGRGMQAEGHQGAGREQAGRITVGSPACSTSTAGAGNHGSASQGSITPHL